jgi:hypothetical protein
LESILTSTHEETKCRENSATAILTSTQWTLGEERELSSSLVNGRETARNRRGEKQEYWLHYPRYLGAVVRAGERGRHARGHPARAGAGPAERPDVLLLPIHLRWPTEAGSGGRPLRWMRGDRRGIKRAAPSPAVEQVRRPVGRRSGWLLRGLLSSRVHMCVYWTPEYWARLLWSISQPSVGPEHTLMGWASHLPARLELAKIGLPMGV